MRKGLITLENSASFCTFACVAGKKEGEGPLGARIDYIDRTGEFGKKTWEQSEAESQAIALNLALNKRKMRVEELDAVIAGDLINQCSSSSYGLMQFGIPFLGVFGACSTLAEGLLIASLMLDSGKFHKIGVVSSSHFCSAERQFRSPVEYGGQRAQTAQRTVTGSGAFVLEAGRKAISVGEVMIGRIVDAGIDDPSNMGAAMAPAALDTFLRYFRASKKTPDDFDLILTGDLGTEGSAILKDLAKREELDLSRHRDCGLLIYDRDQDVHAGGSGCGCSAVVLASGILPKLQSGEYKNVLFAATGALMSADAVKQGLCIPGIAHLVSISSNVGVGEEDRS